jgi:hypothetical protein
MNSVELPTKFQGHPENATALVTQEDICYLILSGRLTYEGAQLILPPHVWPYLPKPVPQQAQTEPPQRRGWMERLKMWRKSS